jgi:hypothetical protein
VCVCARARECVNARISYLDVPVYVKHDVVELEVAVDNFPPVQKQEPACDLCSVELRSVLFEPTGLLDLEQKVSP